MTFDDVLKRMLAIHRGENEHGPLNLEITIADVIDHVNNLSRTMTNMGRKITQGQDLQAEKEALADTMYGLARCAVMAILAIGGNDDRPRSH